MVFDMPGDHVLWCDGLSGTLALTIAAEGVRVFVYGTYDVRSDNKATLTVIQHHTAPRSESHVLIKGVFRDRAQFSFDGVIRIDAGAEEVHATLANRNLLLSPDATVQTKPQLEVVPSSVRCAHSATVSNINPEQLHYLMSRGADEDAARELIVTGFLHDVTMQRDTHNA